MVHTDTLFFLDMMQSSEPFSVVLCLCLNYLIFIIVQESYTDISYFTSEYTSEKRFTLLLDILAVILTQKESLYSVKENKPDFCFYDKICHGMRRAKYTQ